jgi:hypothetical protein
LQMQSSSRNFLHFQIPNVLSTSKPSTFLRPATHPENQSNSLKQPNTQSDFSSISSSHTHRIENFLINNNQTTKVFFSLYHHHLLADSRIFLSITITHTIIFSSIPSSPPCRLRIFFSMTIKHPEHFSSLCHHHLDLQTQEYFSL